MIMQARPFTARRRSKRAILAAYSTFIRMRAAKTPKCPLISGSGGGSNFAPFFGAAAQGTGHLVKLLPCPGLKSAFEKRPTHHGHSSHGPLTSASPRPSFVSSANGVETLRNLQEGPASST